MLQKTSSYTSLTDHSWTPTLPESGGVSLPGPQDPHRIAATGTAIVF